MEEQEISPTQGEDDIDDGIINIWNHIKERWCLHPPKLVISVIDDIETHLMNQQLLKSILVDLVKAAAAAKGKHSFNTSNIHWLA